MLRNPYWHCSNYDVNRLKHVANGDPSGWQDTRLEQGAEQLCRYTEAEALLLPPYKLFPKVERDNSRILKAISVK
jgi:hypothetical protein